MVLVLQTEVPIRDCKVLYIETSRPNLITSIPLSVMQRTRGVEFETTERSCVDYRDEQSTSPTRELHCRDVARDQPPKGAACFCITNTAIACAEIEAG